MSPSSRKIPSTEWERHKATILRLRLKDKLPLKALNAEGRSLIQVMKDEHQFHATASQYESQIAKWGAVKNLKKRDWESILPVYDDLQSQGLEPRIRVGDHLFEDRKIKKARYHYGGRQNSSLSDNIALAPSSDEIRPWCLEFRQPNGQYTEYFKRNENSDLPRSTTSAALVQMDIRSTAGSQPSQMHPHGIEHVFCAADTMTSALIPCPPSFNTPQCEILGMPSSTSICFDPDAHIFSPISPQLTEFPVSVISPQYESSNVDDFINSILYPPSSPGEWFSDNNAVALLSPKGSEIDSIHRASSPSPQLAILAYIDPLLERIALHPRWRQADITELSVNDIFERLVSLPRATLSGSSSTLDSTLVSGRDRNISISDIYSRIMYSVLNNFAGLGPIQRLAVFGFLRLAPDGMSYLVKWLGSDQPSIAKPVASNLFQLAIEAGDEEVVSIILKETSGRSNEINVDKPIYYFSSFRGREHSPLALAARLHHLGVVKTMLAHGAKIGVEGEELNRSAFKAAMRGFCDRCLHHRDGTSHKREVASIVELCLSHEPQRVTDYLIQAFSARKGYLYEPLFEAVPKTQYPKLFNPEAWRECNRREGISALDKYPIPIFRSIQEVLENQAADKMIRSLLSTCQTLKFIPASVIEHTRLLNEATAVAISKNNTKLVRYFLDHIKPTSGHLASAVHNQDNEMVDFILDKGAAPGGEVACLRHMYECMTEAIRWKNAVLINRLEEGGALDTIFDDRGDFGSEFNAAALAAGEVGDFGYLKALISLVPPRTQMQSLATPIVRAIDESQLLVASELIAHHAKATSKATIMDKSYKGIEEVLCAAVGTGNLEFIDQVTEQYLLTDFEAALAVAASLGHTHVVEKLLQRGANPLPDYESGSHNPLLEAIETHNFGIVSLLLEWGASPHCLADAVEAGDESMVRFLLDRGADPADEEAIFGAVKGGKKDIFSTLIGAFSSRYPNGKKQFGPKILEQAISSRDLACLGALFKAKLGVKRHWGQFQCNQLFLFAIGESRKGDTVIYDIICQLLEAGADPDAARLGNFRTTAETALLRAIKNNDPRLVRMLLDRGVDINRPARNCLKRTPLQQACEQGYIQMIMLLLDHGADVNAPAALNSGATALQLAAIQGNSDTVLLLLSKGAKIHDPPALINGRTALEGAAEHGRANVLNILLAKAALGYTLQDIDKALKYADKQGHEGCAHTLKLARFKLASVGVQ
ncbi:unnamed protein product [Clonostachys solani]|uniref:Clr5 domain-containing protein n=1 Tax=Clonostachys solani TaxID=160281 RepID=A0A9N9W452_9HYPO|nr:unnamed protein product [Clonostachys solani]